MKFCPKCGTEIPEKTNKFKIVLPIAIITTAAITFLSAYFILPTSTQKSSVQECSHQWMAATCIEPAKCQNCGEYKDDRLADHHDWDVNNDSGVCKNCKLTRLDWYKANNYEA